MKRERYLIGLMLIAALAAGCTASDSASQSSQTTTTGSSNTTATTSTATTGQASSPATGASTPSESASHGHGHDHASAGEVPAFEVSAAGLKNLAPTLSPDMFTGKTRQAYQAVREIPKTIAQLPCYCHCDKGFGHKSLHSCYVDNHASQCAVCVDEVLMAYRLQKEEKLKPEQIRERIIAQYSSEY